MAAAKMVGLLVQPTTLYSSISDCRLPVWMRSRERSSSQTATPAAESSASLSFCAMSAFLRLRCRLSVAGGVGETPSGRHGTGRDGVAGPRRLHALAGRGHDRLVRQAELLVDLGVGGAGPVVGEADD